MANQVKLCLYPKNENEALSAYIGKVKTHKEIVIYTLI